MNEHEISSHVSENSKLHIVQPEFSTWKYKVKLSAEAVSRGVLQKNLFWKFSQCLQENNCVGVSF